MLILGSLLSLAFANPQAYREWGDWRGSGRGSVLNPPRGRVAVDVRRTVRLLEDMVDKIGGDRLSAYQVGVSVLAQNESNAFIMRYSGAREIRDHEDAEKKRKDERWSVPRRPSLDADLVRHMGFDPEESIYQIGFSTGLLRQLKTDAELAFVVGHELTHLFEGHLDAIINRNMSKRFERWWDSQRHEVIADDGAVVGIAHHYAPRGGVDALNRLAEGGDQKEYLISALTSSHHHEGLRIASAQGRTEHLLLTESAALEHVPRPLPDFVKLHRPGRSYRQVDEDGQRDFLLDLARGFPRSVDDLHLLLGGKQPQSRKYEAYHAHRLSPAQYARIAVEILDIFADPARAFTDRERIDGILILLRIIDVNCPDRSYWAHFSASEVQRITYVLARYAGGPRGWDVSSQFKFFRARDLTPPAGSLINMFTTEKNAARVLARLVEGNRTWREALNRLVVAELEHSPVAFLRALSQGGSYRKMTPDALARLRAIALAKINSSAALDVLITGLNHDWREPQFSFSCLINWLVGDEEKSAESLRFSEEVIQRISARTDTFAPFRDGELIRALGGEAPTAEVFSLLESALVTERFVPFGAAARAALDEHLPRHVARDRVNPYDAPRSLGLIDLLLKHQIADVLGFSAVRLSHTVDSIRESADVAKRDVVLKRLGQLWRDVPLREMLGWAGRTTEYAERTVTGYFRTHHRLTGKWDELAEYAQTLEGKVPVSFQDHFAVRDSLRVDLDWRSAPLVWANHDPELFSHLLTRIDRDQIVAWMSTLRHATETQAKFASHFEVLHLMRESKMSVDAGETALRLVIGREAEFKDPADWRTMVDNVFALNPHAVDRHAEYRPRLSELTELRLARVAPADLMTWVESAGVLSILNPHRGAELLVSALDARIAADAPHEVAAAQVAEVVGRLRLETGFPEIFQIFRERWARHRRQQPNRPFLVDRKGTITERTRDLSSHVRGLSAMIVKVREGKFDEQIDAIEYLMGRSDQPPGYIANLKIDTEVMSGLTSSIPLQGLLSNARERLRRENVVVRTMVANSFLAGPRGVVATPAGVDQLLNRILVRFRPGAREFAEVIARATIHAQDNSASLAFAYCLAQTQGADENPLNFEARMLNSLFSSFGVPGTKYAQYIAFSPDLTAYRAALEDTQDAAMPIGYFEAIRLLEKRFGDEWSERYQVVDVEGSGAVNIALTVIDTQRNESLILNVLRDEIRTASRYHFQKFRRALEYVLNDPRFSEKFQYLNALSRIIEASVNLEFDKPRVAAVHDYLEPLYHGHRGGWTIGTPVVRAMGPDAIFMTKAPGLSARKVWARDPELYQSAMRAFAEIEFEALRGTLGQGAWRTNDLHANPDVHDGQVYIDAATRTLTVLDPGQTVMITTIERDLARDLLTFLVGLSTPDTGARLIEQNFLRGTGRTISANLLLARREVDDPLGSFMRILGDVEHAGGEVSLPILHWIIASHRLVQLGRKIDVDYRSRLGLDLRARQSGLPPRLINLGFAAERGLAECTRRLGGG